MAASKNIIDTVVGFFDPKAGLNRARARMAYNFISKQRGYEGAAGGRRTEGWLTPGTSAKAESERGVGTLRNRSRDLVRNNPFASRALQVIVSNTVGYGIKAQIKNDSDRGVAPLQTAWKGWAEKTDCDFDGRKDYYGLQALVMRMVAEAGEALVIRRRVKSKEQLISFKLQVLEPDFIDTDKVDDNTVQGIQYDAQGRRTGYWIFKEHPGDVNGAKGFWTSYKTESELVSADDVSHVFREDRAGQIRGITWFAPIIITFRDLDEYMDATLVKQKVAASFAAFVTDIEVPVDGNTADSKYVVSEKIEPGAIEFLPQGKTITFPSPPSVNEFDPFTRTMLRALASGLGITYESLTSDYSQVNFSSGRMGWLEFNRNLESWRWNMLIPQFCEVVGKWFFEACEDRGLKLNNAYFKHTPPAREMIDPNAEYNGLQKAVRNGFKTMPEAIRELGNDPEEQIAEIQEFNAQLDKAGIVLDSDPRRIMGSSGSLQPDASSGGSGNSDSGSSTFVDNTGRLWEKTSRGFAPVN